MIDADDPGFQRARFLLAPASAAGGPAARWAPVLSLIATLWLSLFLSGCSSEKAASSRSERGAPAAAPTTPEDAAWLLSAASEDERFARVAKHLRGFDMAMVEVGYRYGELYWAGQDQNWDYAEYQLKKIETAVANGVERRPRRASSARLLAGAIEPVRAAIHGRDPAAFAASFTLLTKNCQACHELEKVPFIELHPPRARPPITGPASPPP